MPTIRGVYRKHSVYNEQGGCVCGSVDEALACAAQMFDELRERRPLCRVHVDMFLFR